MRQNIGGFTKRAASRIVSEARATIEHDEITAEQRAMLDLRDRDNDREQARQELALDDERDAR